MICPTCNNPNTFYNCTIDFKVTRECLACGCVWEEKETKRNVIIIKEGKQILLG